MKIIEKEIKEGFLSLLAERKRERMLQYKFKDEFLESLQNCFENDETKCVLDAESKTIDCNKVKSNDGDVKSNADVVCDVVDM